MTGSRGQKKYLAINVPDRNKSQPYERTTWSDPADHDMLIMQEGFDSENGPAGTHGILAKSHSKMRDPSSLSVQLLVECNIVCTVTLLLGSYEYLKVVGRGAEIAIEYNGRYHESLDLRIL